VQGGAEVCGGVVDVGVVVRDMSKGGECKWGARSASAATCRYNITPTTKLQIYESLVPSFLISVKCCINFL
jgi:hypothetical protein